MGRSVYQFVFLFFFSFSIFTINLRAIPSGDTVPASLLPFSILIDHSITFDRFYNPQGNDPCPYFFIVTRNHVYSSYPIALPILITPLYAPAVFGAQLSNWPTEKIISLSPLMEKDMAALIASLSVVMLFLLVRKIADDRTALFLTLLYAFGTETWSVSSQALWQHGGSELMIICSLYYLKLAFDEEKGAYYTLAGLFAGLSAAIRPTDLLFLAASYVYISFAKHRKKRVLFYSIFPIIIGLMVVGYNLFVFGDVRGGYIQEFNSNILVGLAGVLISPSRGLFVYSPVFIFVLVGIIVWFRQGRVFCPSIYSVSLMFVISHIILISKWFSWYGGWCYGPRLLTDIIPCLIILLIPGINVITRLPLVKIVFIFTLALSITTQVIGSFFYDLQCGWDGTPTRVELDESRLWDWRDNQILRTISDGPKLEPHRELLKRLGLCKGS